MPDPLALVTWFHADSAGRAGAYSQLRGSSASDAAYEVYLRCVDVCAASFRRWNDGPCIVVLNEGAADVVQAPRRALWDRLGVRVEIVPNTHQPGVDLFDAWQNQFFLFDVIRAALSPGGDPTSAIVVVDSDVVVRGPLDALAAEITDSGRVRMRIDYPEDEVANGSSRRDLQQYAADVGHRPDFVPEYQGGEFVAGTAAALAALLDRVEDVYAWTLDRQRRGLTHPNEEAHMISIADPADRTTTTGNRWIERIWTKPWNLRLLPSDPDTLPIWHLPAEKRTGIARLHAAVLEPRSWFWNAPEDVWRARTGAILGVPRYGPAKLLQDVVALRTDVLPAVRERLRRR